MKLAKNQAKAKQRPKAELLLFENYLLFSSILSSKSNIAYYKKWVKRQGYLFQWDLLIIIKMKKRSHRYGINRLRPRHGHKCTIYDVWVSEYDDVYIY